MIDRVGRADFDAERLRRDGDVAVAFLAYWCPYCRAFAPEFEALDDHAPFRVAVADISDESDPRWEQFRIEIVPSIVAFRAGREIGRRDGVPGYGLDEKDLQELRGIFGER